MSLDVYLEGSELRVSSGSGIFVREEGGVVEISREEWDRRHPGQEPFTAEKTPSQRIYSANITHNLGRMASEAGIYQCLWRNEELNIQRAEQLIEPLERGLTLLRAEPEHYRRFNPPNGWGNYEGLVRFVENLLEACKANPSAKFSVWR